MRSEDLLVDNKCAFGLGEHHPHEEAYFDVEIERNVAEEEANDLIGECEDTIHAPVGQPNLIIFVIAFSFQSLDTLNGWINYTDCDN